MPAARDAHRRADGRFSVQRLLALLFRGAGTAAAATAPPDADTTADYELSEQTGSDRSTAEVFIRRSYARNFGTRIEAFMPRLFCLRHRNGTVCGAFGLRSANHSLMVEQCMDRPIEQAVGERVGTTIARYTIAEIGQCCGAFPGAVRAMPNLLIAHLHREGFQWVAFAGSTNLRNAFDRIGLFTIEIPVSEFARTPHEGQRAGRTSPASGAWVLVGNLGAGYRSLMREAALETADAVHRSGLEIVPVRRNQSANRLFAAQRQPIDPALGKGQLERASA